MVELGHHGYKLSAGTLYPLLHSMEKSGLLISQTELENGRKRRVYEAIQTGKEVLRLGKDRVRELYGNCLRKRSESRAAPSQSGLPPVNRSPMLTILALNRVRIRRRYGPA